LSRLGGTAWLRGSGRINVGNAERAEHSGGQLRAASYAAFGAAITECDVDDAHRFEGSQSFGSGKIDVCGLELLFDGAMHEEGHRGDENVCLDRLRCCGIPGRAYRRTTRRP
jgi:hypothetical protein